jgi:predicted dehydrogenase
MPDTNKPVNVGLIGCGAISSAYLDMAKKLPIIQITTCSDIEPAKAQSTAEKYGIRACTAEELINDPKIEIVLNLTVPKAHLPIALEAVAAGKHVYTEKPLGIDREQGLRLLAEAATKNLRIGCAPDTFMGSGIQSARKLIDDGAIGHPVAFTAFMMCPGHESWHPSPEFHYEKGGGPMFDMGPYYLTALLNLLGPVKRLCGMTSIGIPQRTIGSGARQGKNIHVQTPDHVVGSIEFAAGAVGTLITSFATHHPVYDQAQPIVIYGTEGALKVPDPNKFDGPISVWRASDEDWQEVKPTFLAGYGRAVGLAEMAHALRHNRPHRASADQAMTVLDLMQGFLDSSQSGRFYTPTTHYHRPAPMPATLPFGQFDE